LKQELKDYAKELIVLTIKNDWSCHERIYEAIHAPALRSSIFVIKSPKTSQPLIKQLGYDNTHWQTHFCAGKSHAEISWVKRLSVPVLFLL